MSEAKLVYKVNSRTARATQRNTILHLEKPKSINLSQLNKVAHTFNFSNWDREAVKIPVSLRPAWSIVSFLPTRATQ